MTFVITRPCCNDATCVSVCPVNCIHPTPDEPDFATAEMLYINPDQCIDCGACVDACPVEAIAPDFELPDGAEAFLAVNARYFEDPQHLKYEPTPAPRLTRGAVNPPEGDRPRVAIVGSGPAACYAAEHLLYRLTDEVQINIFEKLPAPWGLVRYGIAPDHQHTKAVTRVFERTARRPSLSMHLNVEVGKHLSHDELLAHHHAVIYAVGAAHDRGLDIPGENISGSHSATEFVAWYNGHPERAGVTFVLSARRAVIVGNGNVALDVARILVSDVSTLRGTDMAEHALDALAESNICEVVVLGRRGPAQAAYTVSELMSLFQTPGVDVAVMPDEIELDDLTRAYLDAHPHSTSAMKVELVQQLPSADAESLHAKRITLRYGVSPVRVEGDPALRRVHLVRNSLVAGPDGRVVAQATDGEEVLDCGLLLRSVGYRAVPLEGLPFDWVHHRLPAAQGRVVNDVTGEPVAGVYATGWVSRGPTGFIGTNKHDAVNTVDSLIDDFAAGKLRRPPSEQRHLDTLLASRQPHRLTYQDWQAIDKHERASASRPRTKLVTVEALLKAARRG